MKTGDSDRAVWGMKSLCSLGRWYPGFESHSRYGCLGVCMRLCCPVFRQRPCNGLITRPRSPTICEKWSWKWIRGEGPEWAGRAIGKKNPMKINRTFGGLCNFHLYGRKISQGRNQREAAANTALTHSTYFVLHRCSELLTVSWHKP
jgi:hypothetical protein